MAEQENIRIARKVFDDLNAHNLLASDQYFADEIKYQATGMPDALNREKGRLYTQGFVDAFPDLHFDIKDVIAQGPKVAVTWVATGTHKAPLTAPDGSMTLPATNKKVSMPGVTIFNFRNNLVDRQEIYWDQIHLLTQLGLKVDQLQAGRR